VDAGIELSPASTGILVGYVAERQSSSLRVYLTKYMDIDNLGRLYVVMEEVHRYYVVVGDNRSYNKELG